MTTWTIATRSVEKYMATTGMATWTTLLSREQPLTLMRIGPYQEPKGAHIPSVIF